MASKKKGLLCILHSYFQIDLDTIDVSNLNRQFLFHKQHVGKSKALVARESALAFNPNCVIKAYHDNITSTDYGVNFFKTFDVVMNALDNRAARNHVNRMCLAADIPLIESGTEGYAGQVELIKKGLTQCYECQPKAPQKTYPGCTIRNTPSEPIHCIVWSKHLFNQLFGEADGDEDVSPDSADPEAVADAGEGAMAGEANDKGNVERVSTRAWAQACHYDADKLFAKLFHDDIKYLLSMGKLWETRRPPEPLIRKNLPDAGSSKLDNTGLKDQRIWSIAECADIFAASCKNLKRALEKLENNDSLVWDKDDKDAMDFVTACSNIRSHIFGIPQKSRFDIKSMAGNIIPAIATTNAVIAGIVVLHAFKVLQGKYDECQSVYLRIRPNHRNQQIVPEKVLNPPRPKCTVCSAKPEVGVILDVNVMTVKELEEQVLKKALHMVAPDVMFGMGKVLISSEEGETEENNFKTLGEMGVTDGCILKVDDFLQNYELSVTINHKPAEKDKPEFEVIADLDQLKPKEEEEVATTANGTPEEEEEDDIMLVEDEIGDTEAKKRKINGADKENSAAKKRKVNGREDSNKMEEDDIIEIS